MGACLSVEDGSDEEIPCGRSARRARRKQRKQHIMEVLAAEAKNNELLSRMPGRMSLNGSTSNACIFTQQGRKGTNQDAMIVWESFASRGDTTFCGVFDGHGPFGHLVARKVRDSLPSKLASIYKTQSRHEVRMLASAVSTGSSSEEKPGGATDASAGMEVANADTAIEEDGRSQKMFSLWKDCFLKAYQTMDKELKTHPAIDCFCSGTTAVTMLLQGHDMVIANVGDSRAVLGTLSADDSMKIEAVQLTVDLKPNLPLEAERIKRCKGRVFALEDEPEVPRVWLPHDDSPGLAMARAFGDFCLKDFGLIAVPEVTYTRVSEQDQFVVLASDGVWDVLSNKEVVETIWEAPTRMTAARSLVETAVRAWRLKYPTSKVDDCAVVCFYLNKQQRRQAPVTVSSCTAQEVVLQLKESEVSEGSAEPVEFKRSDTLRSESYAVTAMDDNSATCHSSIPVDNDAECQGITSDEQGDIILNHGTSPVSDITTIDATSDQCGQLADTPTLPASADDDQQVAPASITPHSTAAAAEEPLVETSLPATHVEAPPLVLTDDAPSEITVLSEEEGGKNVPGAIPGRSVSRRSLAECLSVADDDEWSALEGVARVNSLLNLPRFLVGEKRTGSPSTSISKISISGWVSKVRHKAAKRKG